MRKHLRVCASRSQDDVEGILVYSSSSDNEALRFRGRDWYPHLIRLLIILVLRWLLINYDYLNSFLYGS